MTKYHDRTPPGVRVMCDGGREPTTVQKTATADTVVTREVKGEDQDMIRVPISSTRSDRENDEFDEAALNEMADQIRAENPMVFDNHGLAGSWMDAIPYDSRETIGAQMDAEVETADDGESDLIALVNPDGSHPEGERMLEQIRDEGQPVKFSVGFKIINADEKVDDAGNEIGRVFTMADLMETSRVGIPANPDASVNQSMTAKGGGESSLPGYKNHPLFQMMQAMGQGGTEPDTAFAGKSHDGTPGDTESTEGDEVEALREEVADLRAELEAEAKEEGDPCDDNGDCPDGEECVDGECVPEDDDGEEESETSDGDVPEAVKELREENKELRKEVEDIRSELSKGRGDAKTGDTSMSDNPPEPTETDDDESEEQDTENKTAMDLARGS